MKKQGKQVTLQVRVSEELAAEVYAVAESMDMSRSQFIRRAINLLIKELESKQNG